MQFKVPGREGFRRGLVEKRLSHRTTTRGQRSWPWKTRNRAGGRVFPLAAAEAVAACARRHRLALHLDGARLWNASAKTGISEREFAAPFDTVNVCFSKGLGAPVGSALAGPKELIRQAHRFRKMLGGGMRQAGVLASAALYAMDPIVNGWRKTTARLAPSPKSGGCRGRRDRARDCRNQHRRHSAPESRAGGGGERRARSRRASECYVATTRSAP